MIKDIRVDPPKGAQAGLKSHKMALQCEVQPKSAGRGREIHFFTKKLASN